LFLQLNFDSFPYLILSVFFFCLLSFSFC
jgi:hypothetical protein